MLADAWPINHSFSFLQVLEGIPGESRLVPDGWEHEHHQSYRGLSFSLLNPSSLQMEQQDWEGKDLKCPQY